MAASARSRRGPAPKGRREAFTGRYPSEHLDLYKARAASAGLPLGDYLATVLATAHGLNEPDYVHRNRNQPELLTGT